MWIRLLLGAVLAAAQITAAGQTAGPDKPEAPKAAVVSGKVVDEQGDPMSEVIVRALRREIIAGKPKYRLDSSTGFDRTDDRGSYRIGGLLQGEYVVVVPAISGAILKPGTSRSESVSASLLESSVGAFAWLPAPAVVSVIDVGDPLAAFCLYDRLPRFAGWDKSGKLLAYSTRFYSDAASIARATEVKVGAGEARSGVDFQMKPVSTARISGTVTLPGGAPGELLLRLVSADTSALTRDPEIAQATSEATGKFRFLGVPAGEYVIRVMRAPGRAAPDAPTWWGEAPVSVGAEDLIDIAVPLRAGLRIRGKLQFEGVNRPDSLASFPGIDIERVDGSQPANPQVGTGRVDAFGGFSTYGQAPGKYFVRVPTGAIPGWHFKGAMLGSRDLSVTPIELTDHDIEDVQLTFSQRPPSELSGTVKNDRGQPAASVAVVVFPVDRQQWVDTGATPRNLRLVFSGGTGRYSVTTLPAGEYFVAAVLNLDPAWTDPASLDALARTSSRVRMSATDRKTQDLRLRVTAGEPEPDQTEPAMSGPWVPDEQTQTPPPPPPARGQQSPPARGQQPPPARGQGSRGQATPTPAPPPAAPNSASISGVVISPGENPQPIRRAQVTLEGETLAGTPRAAVTDDAGKFAFTKLPAGRYTLTASKPAFVPAAFGASRPGRRGTAIVLADGQTLGDATIRMVHGAAISGVVKDEHGQPLQGVAVQALQSLLVDGVQRFIAQGPAASRPERSDDRGGYRLFGLPPGEFVIAAAYQAGGYGPRFFPGVPEVTGATLVTVKAAEERTGLDFIFKSQTAARVSGRVSSAIGPLPPNTELRLINLGLPPGISPVFGGIDLFASMRPRPDGTFTFTGVAPGRYTIAATTSAPPRGGGAGGATSMWATSDITVKDVDIDNAVLVMQPASMLSGSVSFFAVTQRLPSLSGVAVTLTPLVVGSQIPVGQFDAQTGGDGSFSIRGLLPGKYALRAAPPSGNPNWVQKSVTVRGREAAGDIIEIRAAENLSDLVINFIDRPAEITGTLLDAAGRAASEQVVLLFPADKSLWHPGSRRLFDTRTGTDGKFALRGLPAGNYLLATVNDVEPGEWKDPEFLQRLVATATKITLADGERKVQNVRILK